MARKKSKKDIPVEAVQELADKASQAASIGGTGPAAGKTDENTVKAGTSNIEINIEEIRKTKVYCAMPCYGGMLTESTFMSFIKFSNTARQLGIDWTMQTLVNESLINRARNTLTAQFLHQKDSTHLMFIDADIGWEAWHLLLLLHHNKDVIGGLYPMKTLPIRWVVNGIEGAEDRADGLIEVSKAGTGFLLMKRNVFGKLIDHPAVKPYKNDIGIDPVYDQYLRTYWDTAIRQGRLYSEDWTFSENWRDLGGQIWVDKRVLLKHAGHFNFSMEQHDTLLNEYGHMYVDKVAELAK